VLYLLLALSVVSFMAILERIAFFRKNARGGKDLRARVSAKLLEDDFDAVTAILRSNPSVEARVLSAALLWKHGGADAVNDALDSELGGAREELERSMTLLGTLGNNAPFIGLFGTVLGVIEAFHQLGNGSNQAAMGNVMGGIAEALVATGVGLFVALPAVVAYNVAQKYIGAIETSAIATGKLLSAYLKANPSPRDEVLAGERSLAAE
jgi:biopolymer transport protein ExbB/TolQ